MITTPSNLVVSADAIQAVNAGEEIPDEIEVNDAWLFRLTYHRTDAWRGYYEVHSDDPSIRKIDVDKELDLAGWMTGDWGDAPHGASSSEVETALRRLCEENPDKTYIMVFVPSSNVFATYYDLFVSGDE